MQGSRNQNGPTRCCEIPIRKLAGTVALFTLIAMLSGPSQAEDASDAVRSGTVAKPVDRVVPTYPKGALDRGDEGWVVASFVITEEGQTEDILIEDSNGMPDFERAAISAIRRWTYEPATLDGQPTEQCHTKVMFPFAIVTQGADRGAGRSFIGKYRKAMKALGSDRPDSAQKIVNKLKEKGRLNLYESARLALLQSFLDELNGDSASQLTNLEHAAMSNGEFIEPQVYRVALTKMFVLEVNEKKYRSALSTYEQLEEALGDEPMDPRISAIADDIRKFETADEAIRISGVIGPAEEGEDGRGRWGHSLFRRTPGFVFDDPSALDSYDLRCEFKRAKGKPATGKALRVPEEWGDCWLYVWGRPGADFELVEYGKM